MTAVDFDTIETFDDDESENHVKIGKNDLKALRDAAKNGSKAQKELGELRRERAISEAGLKDLNPKQIATLAKVVEDPTPENLRAEAEALGWAQPVEDPDKPSDAELDAHAEVAAAAVGADAPPKNTISPEDYAGWSIDKRMRLQAQHPEIAEALMREDPNIRIPNGFL